MALLHHAELRPGKLELICAWAPSQPWFVGDDALAAVGAYRFDDPDGVVGIETHLVRAVDGPILQVPLTYRGEPLAGADEFLVGTMQHSVLGERWVYDASGDPVYAAALAHAILAGGTEAPIERQQADGSVVPEESTVRVVGSGDRTDLGSIGLVDVRDSDGATVVATSAAEIEVLRIVGEEAWAMGGETLTGTWADRDDPVLLAVAR